MSTLKFGEIEVCFEKADLEVIPKNYWDTFPEWMAPGVLHARVLMQNLGLDSYFEEGLRVRADNYLPLAVMVGSTVLYWFILVPYIFPLFRPSGPGIYRSLLNVLRDAHNLILCIFSFISVAAVFTFMWDKNEFTYKGMMCGPVKGTWLRPFSIAFTVSKIYEWLDTFFLITLASKPPQFLHVYHHATTFWLFTLVSTIPGTEKMGLLLNGGVHTLMYSHYFRSWPKALVPIITIAQICQLAFVTYSWTRITTPPYVCDLDWEFTNVQRDYFYEWTVPYFMVPVYLYFFIVFFAKRFIFKTTHKSKTNSSKKKQ